jgi:hypothetical protein
MYSPGLSLTPVDRSSRTPKPILFSGVLSWSLYVLLNPTTACYSLFHYHSV